ncbi:hypothetical protein [Streptomyces sp. NBC_00385]|uniref:hypothetical protein n=1 Tax=Streptomyces sp. NBC_00385 TaxID=2975733 RepID=UPI003FA3514E
MSHPQSYEILLVPAFTDAKGTADQGAGSKASGAGDSGTGDAAAGHQDTGNAKDKKEARDTQEAQDANDTAAEDQETEDVVAENSGSHAVGSPRPGAAIRSAVVTATGETGESGYPRYAGEGMVADIDPATHTVQALLIDGSELDYGALGPRLGARHGRLKPPDSRHKGPQGPAVTGRALTPARAGAYFCSFCWSSTDLRTSSMSSFLA